MKKLKLGIIAGVLLSATACTSETDARKALTGAGFSEITMTGYNIWSCSESDFFHTGFRAKNVNGLPVEGTVCSGLLFKGSTIRF